MKVTLTKTARKLRRDGTDTENKLWLAPRNRQMNGLKFKRQVPFGPYIADFLCAEAKLIVEADGGQHWGREEADRVRTRYFESKGYRVLRFWNNDVLQNLQGVLEAIAAKVGTESPLTPAPRGEGARGALIADVPSPLGEKGRMRGSLA
jgi:very-short-patch-repair endonuclease